MPLRLLIVDDHEVVHFGFRLMLARYLKLERCVAAANGAEATSASRRYEPHVALVDLFVGDEAGIDISQSLLTEVPAPKILLISGSGTISMSSARKAGALGFVSKDTRAAEVARAIETVARGETFFRSQSQAPAFPISGREREVLQMLATGATNREIAEQLHLSHYTVQDYARSLFRKLNVRNRTEAVQQAQLLGLVE